MLLVLTAISKQAQQRKFSCQLNELEDVFEILNRVVALGDTLINIHVLDEGKCMNLPPAAFDGSAFSGTLQAMEQQWQTALREPEVVNLSLDEELVSWNKQRVTLYESSIDSYQLMLDRLENLLQRATNRLQPGPYRTRLIEHYQALIGSYQTQLRKANCGLTHVLKRLEQLTV